MELTLKTDRAEYARYLLANEGKNAAIRNHRVKVETMNETAWVDHRAKLIAMRRDAQKAARRMAREIVR